MKNAYDREVLEAELRTQELIRGSFRRREKELVLDDPPKKRVSLEEKISAAERERSKVFSPEGERKGFGRDL